MGKEIRLLHRLVTHQILELLELGVLLGQPDTLILSMDCHFELEQVGPFLTLDDFVVEFGIDKWSIDTIA